MMEDCASVLPMKCTDGTEMFVDTIAGGARYKNGFPEFMGLVIRDKNGERRRTYVQSEEPEPESPRCDTDREQQALSAASTDPVVLPDGTAFTTATLPLPKDHWLYAEQTPPPMGLRCGTENKLRRGLVEYVQEAARYAVRDATMCGREKNFDPDAIVQSMVVGLLGYHTEDGLGSEEWQNPPEPLSQLIYIGYGCPEKRETWEAP